MGKIDIEEAKRKALNNILNSAEFLMGLSIVEKFMPPPPVATIEATPQVQPQKRRIQSRVKQVKGHKPAAEWVLDILERSGKALTSKEITEKMVALGYPFTSKNPTDPMTQCIGLMYKKKLLRRQKIDKKWHYTPPNGTIKLKA